MGRQKFHEERPLKTINVIELVDDGIIGLVSYPAGVNGRCAAEARFKSLIKEHMAQSPVHAGKVPTETDYKAALYVTAWHCDNYSVMLFESTER